MDRFEVLVGNFAVACATQIDLASVSIALPHRFIDAEKRLLYIAGVIGEILERALVGGHAYVETLFGRRCNICHMRNTDQFSRLHAACEQVILSSRVKDDVRWQKMRAHLRTIDYILSRRGGCMETPSPGHACGQAGRARAGQGQGTSLAVPRDIFEPPPGMPLSPPFSTTSPVDAVPNAGLPPNGWGGRIWNGVSLGMSLTQLLELAEHICETLPVAAASVATGVIAAMTITTAMNTSPGHEEASDANDAATQPSQHDIAAPIQVAWRQPLELGAAPTFEDQLGDAPAFEGLSGDAFL